MIRAHFYFLHLLLLLCYFSAPTFAQEEKKVSSIFTEKADNLKLYENPEWQTILFYQKKYFTGKRGIIGGKEFYLSHDGRKNPKLEMEATLQAFFSGKRGDTAAQCLFPRRLLWLKKKLDTEIFKIPTLECAKLNNWLENINPQGVALIFSSFYINNPSSMFGHTLLRIINSDYSLTDFGVNYAANPDTTNMFEYTYKGLTGMFEAKFSLLPYSIKVQEYNNSESRDLYEYVLNISPSQTLNMMLSLWEVGDNSIPYYYADENCSYILLALLDTANPDFNFIDKFLFIVNPADTLRVINEYPGLVKQIDFRPSAERRFKTRFKILNSQERDLFTDILDEKIMPENLLQGNDTSAKESTAKILTAVSEYIDYKEHIAGTGDEKTYPIKRKKILNVRAALGIVSPTLDIQKEDMPENGVYGTRVGTGYSYSTSSKSTMNIEFRPALHDINSPAQGYSPDAQIELLNTVVSYETQSNSFYLNELSFVNILSLPSLDPPLYPVSWGLQAAIKQDTDCQIATYAAHCERYLLSGLSGFSYRNNPFQIYFLPNLQLSYMESFAFESLIGAKVGIIFRPIGTLTWTTSAEILQRYSISQNIWRPHQFTQSTISFSIAKEVESRTYLSYNRQNFTWNFGTTLYWYFY